MLFGLEIHPAIVHFPIALGCIGALAAVAYLILRREWLRLFAPVLLSIALAGAVAAYFSGESAADRAENIGVPSEHIHEHEEAGLWAGGALAVATLISWVTHLGRRGVWLGTILAVMAAGAVLRAGYLGGHLVFVHGAGRVTEAGHHNEPASPARQTGVAAGDSASPPADSTATHSHDSGTESDHTH